MNDENGSEPRTGRESGPVGLGVMGRDFLLNVAERGLTVAGYDLDGDKVERLKRERPETRTLRATTDLGSFVASLRRPRTAMLLVPAGDPVDAVIRDVAPRLGSGDILVDAGNSRFRDTDRRAEQLAGDGLMSLATGVSGGEYGARHGPSIMPGGRFTPSGGADRPPPARRMPWTPTRPTIPDRRSWRSSAPRAI